MTIDVNLQIHQDFWKNAILLSTSISFRLTEQKAEGVKRKIKQFGCVIFPKARIHAGTLFGVQMPMHRVSG